MRSLDPFDDPRTDEPLVIDCDDCSMRDTPTCDDCIVTFLCSSEPEQAVVIDVGYPITQTSCTSLTPGTATTCYVTGHNTHFVQGSSTIQVTWGAMDIPAPDVTVNAMPAGSTAGHCPSCGPAARWSR